MKIVYSHYSFQYSGIDGFAARLFQLLSRETTVEWEIVTTHIPDAYVNEVHQIGRIHWAPAGVHEYATFLQEIMDSSPDLLIATSPHDLFAARKIERRIPIWFWAHGVTPVWDWMCQLAQALDIGLFHINPQLAQKFECPKGRHWVPAYKPLPPNSQILKLLYFGRFDLANKRCDWGLDLVNWLIKSGLPAGLDYVGSGPGESHLRHRISRMGLSEHVRILEPVSPFGDQSWMGIYHHILSFSKLESFGLSLLEGVAQGLWPVFCPVPHGAFDYLTDSPIPFMAQRNIRKMYAQIEQGWKTGQTQDPAARSQITQHFQNMFSMQKALGALRPFLNNRQVRKPNPGLFDAIWKAGERKFGLAQSIPSSSAKNQPS